MNMPGFTAEASLYQSNHHYRNGPSIEPANGNQVQPMLFCELSCDLAQVACSSLCKTFGCNFACVAANAACKKGCGNKYLKWLISPLGSLIDSAID